jgi:hypothetical protein
MTVYDSARDLLAVLELTGVTAFEIVGRRLDSQESTEIQSSMESMLGDGDGALAFRVRQYVKTDQAEFLADYGVEYRITDPDATVSEEARVEFAEKVAFMALVPYLRESVQTTATRLGVQAPLLGMVRQGDFRLHRKEDTPAATRSQG